MTKNGCVWGNSQFTAEIWKRKLGVLAQPPRNGKANDSTKGNIIKVVGGGCSVGIEWGSLLVTTKYLHSSSYLPILLSMYSCTSPHTYYLLFCCALGRNSYFISCYILNTPVLHFWISLDGRRTYYTNYTHCIIRYYTGKFRAGGAGIIPILLSRPTIREARCADLYHTGPIPIQTQP